MGILNFVEEVAGAVIADKALEAADPNAGFLAEAAAAVAGFEGVKMVNEKVAEGEAPAQPATDSTQT